MAYQKTELIRGVLWSGIDKIGVIFVQILLEIVLARHILPKDYGVVGMATIFVAIGIILSESGFSNALIQKQNRTEKDFSTAFYFNLLISSFFVLIIIIIAPFAASFFDTPILTNVLRVLSFNIVFNSLVMVHKTKLSIDLNFKSQAKISFVALIISGIIGVVLAINDFGVWALVVQIVLQSLITVILFQYKLAWIPLPSFSSKSFSQLFSFGSRLLLAGLLHNIYVNIYYTLIGKKMSATTLGIYTKSNQFTTMPASLISGVLQRALFPYFSSFQNNDDKLFDLNQNFTRIVCLVIFPLFLYLSIFAKPLVYFGLSVKWIEAVDVIKILALSVVFFPIIVNNLILFQVKNKSEMYLKLEVFTKIVGGIILLITINHGILALCYGLLIQQIIQFLISSISSNILLGKKIFSQIIIILPYIILGFILWGLLTYYEYYTKQGYFYYLIFGTLIFVFYYLFIYLFILKNRIKSLINLFKNN